MKLLKRLGVLLLILTALCCAAAAADHTAEDLTELYEIMWESYKAQKEDFSVEYTGPVEELLDEKGSLRSCAALTREMAATLPCYNGRGPDIQMMNLNTGFSFLQENVLEFRVTYLLEPDKLTFMEEKAAEIAASLGVMGKGDYQKVKAVQEYMTSAFLYDMTLKKYTDYEGVTTGSMVCQGYALLTYRLLWELNIPCRIVTGISRSQPHGWNLVQVNGQWYAMDTTWDSKTETTEGAWEYFLHAPEHFSGHDTHEPFLTKAFRQEHPFAVENYRLPRVTILVEDELFGSLVIRNGKSILLTTAIDPPSGAEVIWESSDPSVVSVDEKGNLLSIRPGEVTITARLAGDERYIAGTFPVSAVDTSSCSPWAYEELNSFYLRSLYPAELCGDYTAPITREEFAHILYLLMDQYSALSGGMFVVPGFTDIDQSPYWRGIVFTTARKIFRGTGETTFSPTAPLTREQAAKVLCVLLEHMDILLPDGEGVTFTDLASVSPWALDYVKRAAEAGILQGDQSGAFLPREPLTREQAAVLLERLLVNIVEPNRPVEEAA